MKRKRIIVFDTSDKGHHLEYIHHLHDFCVSDLMNDYIFAVPFTIKDKGKILQWRESSHISYHYLTDEECNPSEGWKGNITRAIVLRKLCKEHTPSDVLLISIMAFMPFLGILPFGNVRFSGIVYSFYLYQWSQMTILNRIKNLIIYTLFSKLRRFKRILILNDSASAIALNKIWKTTKFKYLPDPVAIRINPNVLNKPDFLPDKNNKTIFLHAGGFSDRKGTIQLFDIISKLSVDQKKDVCFVFAGIVTESIRQPFYDYYERLKNESEILVYDMFCSFELLTALCKYSSYMILPYKNTNMSSGIISYGAYCGTPVIVPNSGLLGKLVKRYKMGICLKGDFEESFLSIFDKLCEDCNSTNSNYVETHSIDSFTRVMLDI